MAKFEIIMPKLGESIIEATITKWLKAVGDTIGEDDPIVEIATDKVDSEIPSPVEGKLLKILFKEGDVVPVGEIIAIIDMGGEDSGPGIPAATHEKEAAPIPASAVLATKAETVIAEPQVTMEFTSGRFYSPLVKSIAKQENIPAAELESVPGTGKDNRLTKSDLLAYLANRKEGKTGTLQGLAAPMASYPVNIAPGDQIIEMDRMRKLIADHMVNSVKISPHVTSFIEVDMTNVTGWREKQKDILLKRENEKLTFTHIILEAIAKTIKDYPMVNAAVDGSRIIVRKNINIGMAVALPSGNLIVPVIKNTGEMNLLGLVKKVNDIAERARNNKLLPDEIQGGTLTFTNLGSFGTVMGTPIINQPQVAIIAAGAITKRPVVLETPQGDVIAIRQMMYLSISYDHRVIDGALGGKFILKMKEYLENFDTNQGI